MWPAQVERHRWNGRSRNSEIGELDGVWLGGGGNLLGD